MKLIIKRGFCLGHGIDVYPGDTVDLDEITAMQIIRSGKAEADPETDVPAPAPEEKQETHKTRKGARHAQE